MPSDTDLDPLHTRLGAVPSPNAEPTEPGSSRAAFPRAPAPFVSTKDSVPRSLSTSPPTSPTGGTFFTGLAAVAHGGYHPLPLPPPAAAGVVFPQQQLQQPSPPGQHLQPAAAAAAAVGRVQSPRPAPMIIPRGPRRGASASHLSGSSGGVGPSSGSAGAMVLATAVRRPKRAAQVISVEELNEVRRQQEQQRREVKRHEASQQSPCPPVGTGDCAAPVAMLHLSLFLRTAGSGETREESRLAGAPPSK